MKDNKYVYYFGYGANRDPEMMKAILGRVPQGYPATITGFELCVQNWWEIPAQARQQLNNNWGPGFKTYCLRPVENFSRFSVKGRIWKLTGRERKIIDNWEMTGLWYKMFVLEYTRDDGTKKQIEIQVMNHHEVGHVVNGVNYHNFLNEKRHFLQVAQSVRRKFLN